MQENAFKNVQQKPGNELTKLNRVPSHCYNSNIIISTRSLSQETQPLSSLFCFFALCFFLQLSQEVRYLLHLHATMKPR